MDVAGQLGAVRRGVALEWRNGEPVHVVVASQTYDAEVGEVWDAITSRDRIPRWFMPVSGDLRPGGRYQLEGNAGGQVLACEPPHRLSLTWEFGDSISWLDVELTADGAGGTTLELRHATDSSGAEHWAEFGPGATGVGWELGLLGLAQHLAPGEPAVEPSTALAWMASEEGRAFMTRSSQAWGDAAIAAGEDEAVARAAADRTRAAYAPVPADGG